MPRTHENKITSISLNPHTQPQGAGTGMDASWTAVLGELSINASRNRYNTELYVEQLLTTTPAALQFLVMAAWFACYGTLPIELATANDAYLREHP